MARRAVLEDHLKFKPRPQPKFEWRGVFENYARSFVHKNHWRVRERFGSEEDALQEAALVFMDCLRRYSDRVEEPKHLMALFKRMLATHWHDASVVDTRIRSVPPPDDEEQLDFSIGPLSAALSSASEDLRIFVATLATAPADFLAALLANDDPNLLARRVARLCGIKKAATVLAELRSLLS